MKKNENYLSRTFCLNVLLIGILFLIASCSNEPPTIDLANEIEEEIVDEKGPSTAKSSKSVKMSITGISASATHSSNYSASRAIDGNLNTRWTASGTVYLYLDLGSTALIDYVKIAHHAGNSRVYTMKFHVRNSTSASWNLVGTKSSPGNTNGLYDYDLVNSNNRYMRVTCTGNTSNGFSDIKELEIWGTPGSGSSGSSAKDILGGLTNWKLNAYSGSLNVSSSNNGLSYVDSASKNDNSNWFYGSNGYAYFKTYPGNPTSSSGTSNPRTELREMTSNGSSLIHWDGTTSTEHSMKWTVRVDDLPPSGKVCFGQIHAISGSSFDDILRVQVQGSSGQNSGSVTLRLLGYATEDLLGSGQSINFNFNMDTAYSFELTMQNKIVKLYALNSSGSRTSTLFTSGSIDSDANYFKAGCYLQSTSSSDSGSSVYGLVGISSLSVSH
ncbi:polysaccharide lyase family 7 protein [Flavivirga aquimarina]|uniref:Polysaccharide lyase family 7 protein n=1 Tax=Flavivirga aquimarina TaxID=2027862 RepID=A0ABT8WG65_9FLAO|nr:polysaccharide lyase family 7 protein [Flavivirga aquimarina]MDO5972149.1 polysaccharide lyase family 7 protein [Flavivirga aquimarina]